MAAPLANLKILDFSTLLPGPYATMMLADMGAEVLRIEAPDRVDLAKVMPPFDGKFSTTFSYLGRGKRTLQLNLKQPESVERVKQLVQDYDIVVEQFRPGVMDRLGIGYEVLKAINPKLIYCAITGYGQTGPYKDRAGHDINYLAISGVASHCGRADSGPPPMGIQIADVAGGSHHAVMGILAAVIKRQETGEGAFIDISMTDAAFALNAMAGAAALAGGQPQKPESGMLNGGTFYDYYQTRDGRWLSVGSLEPQFSSRLCDTLGLGELKSYALSQKPEHQQELKAAIKQKIAERSLAEWREVFADVDACVEPVLTIEEAAEHPQLKARGMVVERDRGDGNLQKQIGSVFS
ncbi:CaiB/BaiF CoA transferase family protein [Marinobacter nauticus]|uniref:CaiB/BaiF CoA transferase family protein n=1 Tax=Marinobacter nauticus TaxID=2743 RepID=UPI001C94014B|nr:CaiB/BaiF CoA-transferase family protein [Marinobacter nauticus]MBY5938134.1 CoA transferase [Marinobacter nauticus]MBY5955363.1 CoA transferase [Marinobacter nauticus]MBY5962313.1 CoA transferase [Marinobacter nauticus]MBY6009154.1 CoA transferase [Marinobacter nauticus]MBY6102355.1 CoA transferase [Marinobacter nauticus]